MICFVQTILEAALSSRDTEAAKRGASAPVDVKPVRAEGLRCPHPHPTPCVAAVLPAAEHHADAGIRADCLRCQESCVS